MMYEDYTPGQGLGGEAVRRAYDPAERERAMKNQVLGARVADAGVRMMLWGCGMVVAGVALFVLVIALWAAVAVLFPATPQ